MNSVQLEKKIEEVQSEFMDTLEKLEDARLECNQELINAYMIELNELEVLIDDLGNMIATAPTPEQEAEDEASIIDELIRQHDARNWA